MIATPRIQEAYTSRVRFDSGDRIIVRTCSDLSRVERIKLAKAVEGFAGEPVRVLIVDCTTTTVIQRRNGKTRFLASAKDSGGITNLPGTANVNCQIVDIVSGDEIIVVPSGNKHTEKELMFIYKEWAGRDIEVHVISPRDYFIGFVKK